MQSEGYLAPAGRGNSATQDHVPVEIGEKEGFSSTASVFSAVFFLRKTEFSSNSLVSWQGWHCQHQAPWEERAGDAPSCLCGHSRSQELAQNLPSVFLSAWM